MGDTNFVREEKQNSTGTGPVFKNFLAIPWARDRDCVSNWGQASRIWWKGALSHTNSCSCSILDNNLVHVIAQCAPNLKSRVPISCPSYGHESLKYRPVPLRLVFSPRTKLVTPICRLKVLLDASMEVVGRLHHREPSSGN